MKCHLGTIFWMKIRRTLRELYTYHNCRFKSWFVFFFSIYFFWNFSIPIYHCIIISQLRHMERIRVEICVNAHGPGSTISMIRYYHYLVYHAVYRYSQSLDILHAVICREITILLKRTLKVHFLIIKTSFPQASRISLKRPRGGRGRGDHVGGSTGGGSWRRIEEGKGRGEGGGGGRGGETRDCVFAMQSVWLQIKSAQSIIVISTEVSCRCTIHLLSATHGSSCFCRGSEVSVTIASLIASYRHRPLFHAVTILRNSFCGAHAPLRLRGSLGELM